MRVLPDTGDVQAVRARITRTGRVTECQFKDVPEQLSAALGIGKEKSVMSVGQASLFDIEAAPAQMLLSTLHRPHRDALDPDFYGLLQDAVTFASAWIERRHGSADEFLQALEAEFGALIRMHVHDVVEELRRRSTDRRLTGYLETVLPREELALALGGMDDERTREIASLDDLFRRSRRLRTSERFQEMVRFVSRLRRYSPFNNALVYAQNPEVNYFATASHWWKEFGRTVKGDARPMVILAPMTPVLFVYDVHDTEGDRLPDGLASVFETRGEFDEKVLDRTLSNCERLGIIVREERLGRHHAGSVRPTTPGIAGKMLISVNQAFDTRGRYATIVHEIAHLLLGHLGSDADRWWPARVSLTIDQRELEAEAVTYIVCQRAGLLTRSDEYLTGYLRDPKDLTRISVDLIMKTSSKIEEMGIRLLPRKKAREQEPLSR